jgi:hypothetical protein
MWDAVQVTAATLRDRKIGNRLTHFDGDPKLIQFVNDCAHDHEEAHLDHVYCPQEGLLEPNHLKREVTEEFSECIT